MGVIRAWLVRCSVGRLVLVRARKWRRLFVAGSSPAEACVHEENTTGRGRAFGLATKSQIARAIGGGNECVRTPARRAVLLYSVRGQTLGCGAQEGRAGDNLRIRARLGQPRAELLCAGPLQAVGPQQQPLRHRARRSHATPAFAHADVPTTQCTAEATPYMRPLPLLLLTRNILANGCRTTHSPSSAEYGAGKDGYSGLGHRDFSSSSRAASSLNGSAVCGYRGARGRQRKERQIEGPADIPLAAARRRTRWLRTEQPARRAVAPRRLQPSRRKNGPKGAALGTHAQLQCMREWAEASASECGNQAKPSGPLGKRGGAGQRPTTRRRSSGLV